MSFVGEADPDDINADMGPTMVRLCVSMMVLSTTAVVLRFVSRKVIRQPLQWDDWMILISLIASYAAGTVEITGRFA